jgi:type II secretory pathway component PulL
LNTPTYEPLTQIWQHEDVWQRFWQYWLCMHTTFALFEVEQEEVETVQVPMCAASTPWHA